MKTILVIDDDPHFRALLVPTLTDRGHKVIQAGSGEEAEQALRKHQIDLAVVDGLLPDTDGLTFITQLRKTRSDLKIIFVSAYWWDDQVFGQLTNELDVALVLHKPVIPSLFGEQVDTLVSEEEEIPASAQEVQEESVEQVLAALKVQYAAVLPGKLAELAHALNQFKAIRADEENNANNLSSKELLLNETITQAHTLKGTAGTYGFIAIGELVGKVEQCLLEIENQPELDNDNTWAKIDQFLTDATKLAKQDIEPQGPTEESGYAHQVLVLDDDTELVQMAEKVLKSMGKKIVKAKTIYEALEKLRTAPVEAALINMNIDSPDVMTRAIREIRLMPSSHHLPFANIVPPQANYDRQMEIYAGAAVCLPKPASEETLQDSINDLFKIRHSEQSKIVLIDDDESFRNYASAVLEQEGMRVFAYKDPTNILSILEEVEPHLLLLDVIMPGFSGFDVCRLLRATHEWRGLPVLFVTSRTGHSSRLASFQSGGDDYLVKPLIKEELLSRVSIRLEYTRLIKEKTERDTLTGLWISRPLLDLLSWQVSETHRNKGTLTLAMLELNNFGEINDKYGYQAGDRVFLALGQLLQTRFRPTDLRGRWGGVQFILSFPDENVDTVSGAMEMLHEELSSIPFYSDNGEIFHVGFRYSTADLSPNDTTPQLIKKAREKLKQLRTP